MKTMVRRLPLLILGAVAAWMTIPAHADEPQAVGVRNDPMYMAVFGGSGAVASIRTPLDIADHAAMRDGDWLEVAAEWRPRTVPLRHDAPR